MADNKDPKVIAEELNKLGGLQFAAEKNGTVVATLNPGQVALINQRKTSIPFMVTLFGVGVSAQVDPKTNQLVIDPKNSSTADVVEQYKASMAVTHNLLLHNNASVALNAANTITNNLPQDCRADTSLIRKLIKDQGTENVPQSFPPLPPRGPNAPALTGNCR